MAADGRFLVDRDGTRHLRVMKGLVLSPRQVLVALAGLAFLVFLPDIAAFTSLSFRTFRKGLLFGIAAIGLNLVLRHTQLVSFGHAAFFGAGAYTAAILASTYNVPHTSLLILGAFVVATLLGVTIGYLVSGYLDIYFSLLTLAFNGVLFALVLGSGFFNYNDGVAVRPASANRPLLAGIEFSSEVADILNYYISVVLLLVLLLIAFRIVRSPFGRALDAIGQDRTRARFIGIPVERYVWIVFTMSAAYGGLAGGMFALLELHVRPEPTLFIFVSGEILFMAILGGFSTLLGPLVGGIVLVYVLDLARFVTDFQNALAGVILLGSVYFLPRGIVGSRDEFYDAARAIREDPSVIGTWIANIGPLLRRRAAESAHSMRQLLGMR